MRSDLLDVVAALHFSRKIFSVIKRNLIWVCVYNVLAMGMFLPFGLYMYLMLAGVAMAFSSVSVVTSSLTLKWWKRPTDSIMPGEEEIDSANTGAGWTEMFMDSAGTALDSVGGVVSSKRGDGYSQLPLEMSLDERYAGDGVREGMI